MRSALDIGRVAAVAVLVATAVSCQCPPPAWSTMNALPGVGYPAVAVISRDPDRPGPAPPVLVIGGGSALADYSIARGEPTWVGSSRHSLATGRVPRLFSI